MTIEAILNAHPWHVVGLVLAGLALAWDAANACGRDWRRWG